MTDDIRVLPGVATAQFRSFAANMPPFYASVIATMLTAMIVFYRETPGWFAVGMPFLFVSICLWRIRWWTTHRNDPVTDAQAGKHLIRATAILIGSTVTVMAMDVAVFPSASIHARYYVAMQILASTMAGFYCLMHLRAAASLMAIAMMVPFTGFMLAMRDVGSIASAINSLINVGLMMFVMSRYQREFTSLVRSEAATAELSKENIRLANLDMLTGLPNRRLFFDTLLDALQTAAAHGQTVAVGIADLDGFKPVNDTHGHRVGDAVLAEVARRMTASAESVFVARVGGDEFGFVITDFRDRETLLSFGDQVIKAVSTPIQVGSIVTSVGCSLGFALYPEAAATSDVLYECADYALYHAKRSGRSKTVVFADNHEAILKEQGKVEQALRGADLEQEMFPVFQPIVDTEAGKTKEFESLARWQSPVLGMVSPAVFIPVAEQAGLIGDITLVLLRKSLEAAAKWPTDVHLSFNVSPFDISSQHRTLQMISIISGSTVEPSRISIELTETALLHSFAETNANMRRLQELGVNISLDDFGTGYSSLSHIHALPFDKLKIDKSFVDAISSNPRSRDIVRSLILLCKDMGIGCVVEGIETAEQLDVVHQLGARNIQGYFFSRPIEATSISAFLSAYDASSPHANERSLTLT
ncbi:EAL domain-containing protein [Paraburkholderia sp. PREW-6R]|uniref:putative bifunctional diguanylate cyclase/phosphodiesterase n=1 Tax=Paraburkholderia sp. PREW-6R TaxID=3141544 RepID=UPI0031F58394